MRKPKIIFLKVNMEKEIKKQKKRELKNTLSKMQNDLSTLINADNETFDEALKYISNSIQAINNKELKKLYKEYNYGANDYKKINKENIKDKEVAISLADNLNLDIDENRNEKINSAILNIFNKIDNFLNKKSVKVIMGFAIALFFGALALILYKENTLAVATVAPMSEIPGKITIAYNYIKTLGFVVAFVFLAVELIQSGLKGDTRAMAMIFAKYLMFSVALLSFKAIYDMIDEFFNS